MGIHRVLRSRPGPLPKSVDRWMPLAAVGIAAMLSASCSTPPPAAPPPPVPAPEPAPSQDGRVLGRSERFVIYQPAAGDTLRLIAARFLGSESLDWVVGDFNGIEEARPGHPVVVPIKRINPLGVYGDWYQTVPILCYHRFGAGGGKMTVPAENFAAQLEWLARNDYHVLALPRLLEFLQGHEPLPRRSVVITIDDGYESVYRVALPLLRKHGFHATVFVYTDFVGAPDALTWAQLQEMEATGLIDVQAHSKTHRNLIERDTSVSDERYQQMLETEARVPRDLLERKLPGKVSEFAFPYGDANQSVLDVLARQRYQLGLTVNPGGNGFFAQPMMLRRTMIFGDQDLASFKRKLQISRGFASP